MVSKNTFRVLENNIGKTGGREAESRILKRLGSMQENKFEISDLCKVIWIVNIKSQRISFYKILIISVYQNMQNFQKYT